MDKMKELYEKITENTELKMRLDKIMKAAEKNGQMELSQEELSEVAGGASSQPCDLKKKKIFL